MVILPLSPFACALVTTFVLVIYLQILRLIHFDRCLHSIDPPYHILRFSELHQMRSQVKNRY